MSSPSFSARCRRSGMRLEWWESFGVPTSRRDEGGDGCALAGHRSRKRRDADADGGCFRRGRLAVTRVRRSARPASTACLRRRDLPGAFRRVDRRAPRCVALDAHGGERLTDVDLDPPLTLLLGSEREGLPAALVTQCHKATIPLTGRGRVAERRRGGSNRALRVRSPLAVAITPCVRHCGRVRGTSPMGLETGLELPSCSTRSDLGDR